MEPEEEPGGAAVREVYEEVTKPNQNPAFLLLLSPDRNQDERGNSASIVQDFTVTSTVVKFKRLQLHVLELGRGEVK